MTGEPHHAEFAHPIGTRPPGRVDTRCHVPDPARFLRMLRR